MTTAQLPDVLLTAFQAVASHTSAPTALGRARRLRTGWSTGQQVGLHHLSSKSGSDTSMLRRL